MIGFARPLFRERLGLLLISLGLFGLQTNAQVRQVRQFSFAPKQPEWTWSDLSGHFEQQSLAVTTTGDFLVFSANRAGTWNLYRIRDWDREKPSTDHIQMPGYFSSRDDHDLENLDAHLYVTPDGRHAICVATAEWLKRVSGKAVGRARTTSIITVIDLSTFKIVNSTQASAADPYEFQSVELDGDSRMLVISDTFGAKAHGEFVQLDIPSLRASNKCEYGFSDGQYAHPAPVTADSCKENLRSMSLEEYLKAASPNPSRSPGFTCKDTNIEYCPEPESFTPDKRFGLGMLTEGHDGFFGGWVETRATAIIFSTSWHAQIGEIDLTHQPARLELAAVNGQDYLLALRAGSQLTVYQLNDANSAETH